MPPINHRYPLNGYKYRFLTKTRWKSGIAVDIPADMYRAALNTLNLGLSNLGSNVTTNAIVQILKINIL